MATSFTKEERVVFDDVIASFEDQGSYTALATKYTPLSPTEMAHTRDRFWMPAPMIGASYDGFDQTSNFDGLTELAVPVSVNVHKAIPKTLSAKNLRNEAALRMYAAAAKQTLASNINTSLRTRVALEGSIFTKRTVSPTGFDDVALSGAQMTEIGVPSGDRAYMVGIRAGIGMRSNLAGRSEDSARSRDAYTGGRIQSGIAGFDVYEDDQPIRLAAASGGTTTVNGANQYWEPASTTTESSGELSNRDNRYSDLIITATTYANIKAGDAFTIAGVNSVHMISKQDTGQLQTFRVISKPAANTIRIAPAIISNQGATIGGKEYQNVSATPANSAAITWLNTATAEINPFFVKGSLLLIPGSYSVEPEDGWNVMRATTPDYGLAITYARQGNINDLSVKIRWDVDYGTALLNPQFAGATMFNQT